MRGGTVTNYSQAYDYADIRLQYKVTLPQGVSMKDVDWSWNISLDGTTSTVKGVKYLLTDEETNTYTTNVVLVNIPVINKADLNFEAWLSVSFDYNGTTYSFTQGDTSLGRVLSGLVNSYSENEFAEGSDGLAYIKAVQELLKTTE